MKRLVIGILAHVDAGKTTLAESILYQTGSIRFLGRVDHKNAFLDTYELERSRGITIFSKQAVFTLNDAEVTLLDTPGHVDFSAEMERTLQILDYAILVISGSDGVQGHTETLWRLLRRYRIPTFLFVNKMDMEGTDREALLGELQKRLSDLCVDFSEDQSRETFLENLAMCNETLLENYMENGAINTEDVVTLIAERRVFPCYFGSALRLYGVEDFLYGLEQYTRQPDYPEQFGAKIYKIARDDQGMRLTYMKITGGSLKVKMLLSSGDKILGERKDSLREKEEPEKQRTKIEDRRQKDDETMIWEEKVNQIRVYSGSKYEAVDVVEAGAVCAVTGLSRTYPGEGLGMEAGAELPLLEPILNYQVLLPFGCDILGMLMKLRQLEEEDPQLHIVWNEQLKEIHIQLMGEVQVEILKSLILERFGIQVEFGPGNIVYKETILEPVVGVGHFEPLRHYAEVHLLMEPAEPGSGLEFTTVCSEDVLDRNWQRLILSHLEEKEHVGVLTGSVITDMKITLMAGRAHLKHTEGGDFRQATYRAVRQGLKMSKSILLEPYYSYKLILPSETVGRAMSDIQRMSGNFNPPEVDKDMSILTGNAPVATMRGYQMEVADYTSGRGKLYCSLKGYEPCHNGDEVIEAIGYDSEQDLSNPTGSVFCSHGAGFVVEWDRVQDYMHIDSGYPQKDSSVSPRKDPVQVQAAVPTRQSYGGSMKEDEELEAIFTRTYGPLKQKPHPSQSGLGYEKITTKDKTTAREKVQEKRVDIGEKEPIKEYLLVDGYNIIFSWDKLHELAKVNMDAARMKLMDILCNYQGYKKCIVILVFDAYKVKGGLGVVQEYHNIHVVYTKEAETADMYIEKVTHQMERKHRVVVATSDYLEQMIILGQGAARLSAKDLKEEIARVNGQIRKEYLDKPSTGRSYMGSQFNEDIWNYLAEDLDTEIKDHSL